MVDMKEILGSLWTIFSPFLWKAALAIAIVSLLGLGIDIIAHKLRNRNKK